MSTPFEYMAGLDRRGEAYVISVTMDSGASFGNLAVLKHDGHWLHVRKDEGDSMPRPFWLRAASIEMIEVEAL